jgi:two-component system OmpR family sensor kinase
VGGSEQPGDGGPDLSGLTIDRARELGTHATTIPSVDGPEGYRIRMTVRSDGRIAVLALSLHSMESVLHRLKVVAFLTALIVLAAVVALSAVVVRLGMQPPIQMEHTVEAISRGDLSRRVPAGPARTEVGRLGAAFNGMLSKIEAAFRQKEQSEQTLRQFVADAGHELRTPLSTIRGYAELTRSGALRDQPARDQALERIEAEATRLGVLVDELLLLARLDQHRPLNPTEADLVELAKDAVADAQIRDLRRDVSYQGPEQAAIVQVDADRIRQVLTNLLSNALIHTTPGTPVRVRVETVRGMVQLSVEDEGPGLSPDQVARVFERFYRVDASRGRASGGSGLGLAIVQGVVAASGGTVRCESTVAGGTTFTVALPVGSS